MGSMGLVFGNTTALALDAARRAAGTASAALGATQFALAAAVTPLVSISGENTAVPAAIVMVCASTLAVLAFACGGRNKSSTSERENDISEVTSIATVSTERAARYGKQLVSHMGRMAVGTWDETTGSGTLAMGEAAHMSLTSSPSALLIELRSPNDTIATFEDVVARHLERFGDRDELKVVWARA
jgi:hypothetical protein